jgi:hypothetical protein
MARSPQTRNDAALRETVNMFYELACMSGLVRVPP